MVYVCDRGHDRALLMELVEPRGVFVAGHVPHNVLFGEQIRDDLTQLFFGLLVLGDGALGIQAGRVSSSE